MKKILQKMLNLDRRILFIIVVVLIVFPIIRPLNLPGLKVTDAVRGVYDVIEALPPGAPIVIVFDFDPASKPELYPMGVAIVHHAFRKDLRIIGMNLWPTGTGLADEILTQTAKVYNKEYKKDYVFLGYQPSPYAVITGVCTDLYKMYPKDQKGNETKGMPVLKGIKSFQDIAYLFELTAGAPGLKEWIMFGSDKFGFKIGAGCTAVSEPSFRPYLATGQITGLLPAMKGAAEYETLIEREDKATAGLDAISLGHFLIIVLLLMCNFINIGLRYFK